ncbi:anti-sigma-K factor RskA [Azorhizobium sp. AG788]|uniref:anti-sigma factor n=1 Tax=Azorhizobium sp. AG788 TaxID=2183897 RepID=UPI00105D5E6E|nr:anti-sigma factor [Azorhizobium sp. AG788]TDT92585.1 anti-sigma-K factor RskA [Azorhizobium sp. AG788]
MNLSEDDRQFVAEYVLGTLPAALRLMIRSRIEEERAFGAVSRQWEQRLSPLHELVVPVAPPADLWRDVAVNLIPRPIERTPDEPAKPADAKGKAKDGKGAKEAKGAKGPGGFAIPAAVDAAEAPPIIELAPNAAILSQMRRWRWAAIGLGVLLVACAGTFGYREWDRSVAQRYFALLQEGRAASVLVRIDVSDGDVTVRPLVDPAPAGKSYQLWIVPDGQSPRSLGTFSSSFATRSDVVRKLGAKVAAKATLQVTLEPEGGTSELPSGDVLYSGRLLPE